MKNRILWCGLLCLLSVMLRAQELQVSSFEVLEKDLMARTNERLDLNDEPCAVLRVSVADAKSFRFAGNIIGDVIYHPGEAIVYLTGRSRKVQISSDKFGVLEYEFPARLQQRVVYRLTLNLVVPESKKTRTLVMPVAGIGKAPSYGIMLGIVRRWGGYVKVKYSFTGQSTDLSCDDDGIVEGTSDKAWFTGEKEASRFAVTAGGMLRMALPLYLYAGVGYGYKKLAWEMVDNRWAEASQHSYTGLESEIGLIYRMKNFAISCGVQDNRFKYWEANVGIAIMF